jgi:predicted TIM-barrel fold metal-dependent hydrolase
VRALDWQVEIYLEGPKLAAVLPRIRDQGVKVVVDHFGAPDPSLGVQCPGFQQVLRGVRSGNTFVKLSAPYRQGGADAQVYVDALLEAGGPKQLVWATDWPFVGFEEKITYSQCVDWIETWIPDDATRRTVMAETPARLFHFEEKA